jgi:hypothetical protein
MGGGLMELVAKGAQDIYLTGNPNVTYFKSIFKRHTNFSIESIQQNFTGDLNFGKRISCTIKRTGDLLSGITVEIDLPTISGKRTDNDKPVMKWTNSIGHSILNSLEIEIGGQIIDRQYGEWMEIWSELTTQAGHLEGFKTMIGKSENSQGEPANKKVKLIIPLHFWFCRNIGLAIPLVALQYHEVKLFIELKPFDECWKKDVKRYYVETDSSNQNRVNIVSGGELLSESEFNTGDVFANQKFYWESDRTELKVSSRNSASQITLTENTVVGRKGYAYLLLDEPDKQYSIEDIRVYCEYIFLDTNERKYFAQNQHIYLIEQLQYNGNSSYIFSQDSSKIDLEFNHPCKELFWVTQMNISKLFNLNFNFSNNVIIDGGENPIVDCLLNINGQERFSIRNANHFRFEVPLKRHTRIPSNFIYVYSFSLKPEQSQPSGTCNFSRLDSSELIVNFQKSLNDSNTRVYALNYNILNVKKGMGGLAYSN